MRSLFLITDTNECTKYVQCFENLKLGETGNMIYNVRGLNDDTLYGRIKEWKPDIVVYIGCVFGQQPSIATISRINQKIAPAVHICSDAADSPWWPLLREYNGAGCFALQVAIDGSHKWPLANSQMTALTPVDPIFFRPTMRPHAERGTALGYAGNPGSGEGSRRTAILSGLLAERLIDLRIRSNLPFTYEAFCTYLSGIRMSLNVAYSGTEATTHVKGRVLESALAGACLLETRGSPTSYWFRPGLDYLEYDSPGDVAQIVRRLENEPEATQAMGESLRQRVLKEHSPLHFWQRIFDRIGMKP